MAHMSLRATNTKPFDRLNLRLSPNIFVLLDQACALRPGNLSRNTEIAEAIQQQLAREIGSRAVRVNVAQGGD
jgi:uncharacterized protein (DUF1778 family)